MILIIDNYDSFVYNLVQYVGEFDDVSVVRNDEASIEDIECLNPDGIIVSPGPGTPQDAGISVPIFSEASYPTLGVCLGHQALCAAHGATVKHAPSVVHGKQSDVYHEGEKLYDGLSNPFEAGRYHSLVVDYETLPDEIVETAYIDDGDTRVSMGVRHRHKPHMGVQFHPESILTDTGKRIIENFVKIVVS
ncbi:anthranilate synthase component II [Haloferax profundi]|uniref:anthranilate synthase n=1 Tax=Haloferax profundi TaxID=1544718 RepID=A0A0W1S915_9EURY|nr:aminodeoxychorismate/anthranilate synthase component II [Haloferax profundi]KTG22584.1 anthranilate synthase [Haloferax profundi]